ncbi:DUF2231 domain-containing protein [Sphingobium vermicomposti]|uniref:Putative membrane protein n=1 Tax=Sphingobium vermicomposti TaxID=529005 RepID=A0A846M2D4_9SPHN|nr:DUF2231 domain-containing protein [Sphingobium vermicomposti]NIJ16317.1 putative membrane protein [Sphingobium vermicomposti]
MHDSNPNSTASVAGHPLHPMLIPFPIAFFVGALVVDIVYRQSLDPFWPEAAAYLLGAGLAMAALAALAGLTDFLGDRRIRSLRAAWYHLIGNVTVVLIEAINLWGRIEDGISFVLPAGLGLSIVATLMLLFNGWKGWEMVYRHRVGIAQEAKDLTSS